MSVDEQLVGWVGEAVDSMVAILLIFVLFFEVVDAYFYIVLLLPGQFGAKHFVLNVEQLRYQSDFVEVHHLPLALLLLEDLLLGS